MSDVARRDRPMGPEQAAELADAYDQVLARLGTKGPALRREIERTRDALRKRAEASPRAGEPDGALGEEGGRP